MGEFRQFRVAVPVVGGEPGELVQDAGDTAVGGLTDADLTHSLRLVVDDCLGRAVLGEDGGDMRGEPAQQVGGWCQRDQDGQQCRLVDEQGDLGAPEQDGGLPLPEQRVGLLVVEVGLADTVEELLGCAHQEHQPIVAQPVQRVPAASCVLPNAAKSACVGRYAEASCTSSASSSEVR